VKEIVSVTADLDYCREHFAAARTPLVFSSDTHKPAVFKGLIVYEYARAMADDVHGGKVAWNDGKATLTLDPEDVMLIELP
jgi:hypothetical protein